MLRRPSAPRPRRSTSSDTADGIEITIPPPNGRLRRLGSVLVLGWWVFGEAMIASWLLNGEGDFETKATDAVMALMWSLVGLFALYRVLYDFTGRERVRINSSSIVLARDLAGRTRERHYDRSQISDLRIFDPAELRGKLDLELFDHKLAFDHAGDLIRFGSHIDDAEARWILDRLKEQLGR